MILYIIIILLIAIYISCCTLWFHKKPSQTIFQEGFSKHQDLWIKKEGNQKLVIFLHGMYSQPKIFEEIANLLVNEGYDTYAPVLPNCSISPDDLNSQNAYQWLDSIKVAFQRSLIHNQNYKEIVLGGHSQGGSLALSIAPSLPFLKGLIIVASPIHLIHNKNSWIRNLGIHISGLLCLFRYNIGMFLKVKNHTQKSQVEGHCFNKEYFFGITLHSMKVGLKSTRKNLKHIKTPCLLIYEQGDRITHIKDINELSENIGSSHIEKKILNTSKEIEPYSSRHRLFSYIHTKDLVNKEIINFIKNLSHLK